MPSTGGTRQAIVPRSSGTKRTYSRLSSRTPSSVRSMTLSSCDAVVADRNDQPATDVQLLEQRLRHAARRGGDDDAVERSLVRPTQIAVVVFDANVAQLQRAEAFARPFDQRRDAFDRDTRASRAPRARPSDSPEPVPISSTRSRGRFSSVCVISATMNGCEIVWPWPIGSAVSSYARCANASSMKMCRGIAPITIEHALVGDAVFAQSLHQPVARALRRHTDAAQIELAHARLRSRTLRNVPNLAQQRRRVLPRRAVRNARSRLLPLDSTSRTASAARRTRAAPVPVRGVRADRATRDSRRARPFRSASAASRRLRASTAP